jgi:hypothetical protein
MSDFFQYIAIGMWIIGFLGIIIFAFLAIVSLFKKKLKVLPRLLGAGGVSIAILFIGIVLGSLTEKNYWERQEMSDSEEKENEEIIKNIQKNQQATAEAHERSIKEQERALEESQQNKFELEPLDEQGVYNAVVGYGNSLIEAINNGDFSIVESYLLPHSNLYLSQVKLVDDLYNKGIIEHLYTFNIELVRRIDENKYEVQTFEEIGIEDGKKEDVEEFQWVYTVENVNGQYLLSDIKKAS